MLGKIIVLVVLIAIVGLTWIWLTPSSDNNITPQQQIENPKNCYQACVNLGYIELENVEQPEGLCRCKRWEAYHGQWIYETIDFNP